MKTMKYFQRLLIWLLVFIIAVPPPVFAQDGKADVKKFSQEEMDQMMAPIALYPDSLLAQIFIAATYPLEVVMADRWVKQNKDLAPDQLNAALDKQPWDASVKALVPFPTVLSMMSEKADWTQRVGDAFLAQETDVMDTVQKLRKKAAEAGNLKTTEQQKVIVEKEGIRIEPANSQVVYVPVYDPWWVYGPWWWPGYPPYVVYRYPPGAVIAAGVIWFGVGLLVGAFWGHGWGYWDWGHRHVFVNVDRTININRRDIHVTNIKTEPWRHDLSHRRGVAYRDQVTRERFGQVNRAEVEKRRSFRGFEGNWIEKNASRSGITTKKAARPGIASRADAGAGKIDRPEAPGKFGAVTRKAARPDVAGKTDAGTRRIERPDSSLGRQTDRPYGKSAVEGSRRGNAFEGIGQGTEVRRQSVWGRESLSSPGFGRGSGGGVVSGGAGDGGPRGGGIGGGFHRGGNR
jgi:hypothetical protein